MTKFSTEHEAFWAGAFGSEYTERNQGAQVQASNFHFFSQVVARLRDVRSVLEPGANRGLNLEILRSLLPGADLAGIEINPDAAALLKASGFTAYAGSLLDFKLDHPRDLAFTKAS